MAHGILERLFSGRTAIDEYQPVVIEESGAQLSPDCRFEYALEALPGNAMFCDTDLVVCFVNRSAREALREMHAYVPVSAESIVGQPLHVLDDFFPHSQSALRLARPTTVTWGPVKLDFQFAPMTDASGRCAGAVVVWSEHTAQDVNKSEELRRAEESQHNDLEHLTGNLHVVATASQQIEASIAEIAKSAEQVAVAAQSSRTAGEESKAAIESLRLSSTGVGKVAELISSIATQTSVLALNANIEAARAGIHGKGFAVVASEVRKLAEQTAAATAEIQTKVATIGSDIQNAIAAIDRIGSQLDEVSGLSNQVAAATEEQHVVAREMAHNVGRAAFRAEEIAKVRVGGTVLD